MEMPNLIMEPKFRNEVSLEDKLLYLFLLSQMPNYRLSAIDSMKYTFIIKIEAYLQKKILFRSHFKMLGKGPVSYQIYGCRDALNAAAITQYNPVYEGTNEKPTEFLQLYPRDYLILDWIEIYSHSDPWAFDFILEIIDKYHLGDISWRERQNKVYNMYVNGKQIKNYNKQIREDIDLPYYDNWQIFQIHPEKKREQFWYMLDHNYYSSQLELDKHLHLFAIKDEII